MVENIIKINYRSNNQLELKNSYYKEISQIHSFNVDLYNNIFKKFHIMYTFEPKHTLFLSKQKKNIASHNRKILNIYSFKLFLKENNIKEIEINSSVFKKHDILENNPKILASVIAVIIGVFSKNILVTIFGGLTAYWFLIFI